jgi:hypothetical protein
MPHRTSRRLSIRGSERLAERASRGPRLVLLTGSLVTLISLLILGPETRFARSAYALVMGLTLLLALSTAGIHRRLGVIAGYAAGVLTLLAVVALEGGLPGASFGDLAVMAALVFAVPAAVLFGLRDERTVNLQTVFGAIAVYLDIGLLFALLISIDVRVSSAAYFAQHASSSMSERVYFSFVTLATLGYGDLTPAGGTGRLFSVAESLLGSLYLVTAVSLVVSRVGSARQLQR